MFEAEKELEIVFQERNVRRHRRLGYSLRRDYIARQVRSRLFRRSSASLSDRFASFPLGKRSQQAHSNCQCLQQNIQWSYFIGRNQKRF